MMKESTNLTAINAQRMTSLNIAAITGKQHKVVLKAIRNMEPAWESECGHKFVLTSERVDMPQGGVRLIPVFSLTKEETLYIATKFNDQARARLVLRWEELEKRHLTPDPSPNGEGRKNPFQANDQKLLVTEAEILHQGDEIRRVKIADENADNDGCLTVSDIAKMLNRTVKEVNRELIKAGVQYYNGGRYKLTANYEGLGLACDRSFHYYSLEGEKKERAYLVWTPVGLEFIKTII
jgi:phage regulator Rha-like protein